MPEDKEDKVIDLPSDGPGAEVTLPEETVKEGAQDVDVPEKKTRRRSRSKRRST